MFPLFHYLFLFYSTDWLEFFDFWYICFFFLLYPCLYLVGKGKNEWENLKKWMIKENKICSIYNNKKPHTGNSQLEEKLVTLIFIKTQIADQRLTFCLLINFEWFNEWTVYLVGWEKLIDGSSTNLMLIQGSGEIA